MPSSDRDDIDVLCVGRERFQIVDVGSDHCPSRFSGRDHERINGGAASRESAEKGSSPGEGFGDGLCDVASLEKLVFNGVATRVALETLDQNYGGDMWWPQSCFAQGQDQGQSLLRTFGEAAHPAGVEDQHGLACLAGSPLNDALGNGRGSNALSR